MISTSVPDAETFLATDRCDRCTARAQVRAELTAGELLFCGHHARMHRTALESVALLFTCGDVAGTPDAR